MNVPVNKPLLDGNEKKYLIECIDSGWISSEGPFIKQFEDAFSTKINRKYGIAVSNGTGAIDAVIEALDIRIGDEIIMPAFTIISCVNQIIRNGAIPVLIDCDVNTFNMNVDLIEKKITSRTKAIMVVHIYGLPVDMDKVLAIAKKYNLFVIEDAAEMHGQTYNGKPCGSFGDVSIFSFYPNKHITTGEGGMIVTNNKKIADDCRDLRNLCFKPEKRFVHDRLGWNLRMTNVQAAIGLAQLERLDEFVSIKRKMGKYYSELLSDIEGIQLPVSRTNTAENIYWVYTILLDKKSDLTAQIVIDRLSDLGVGCRPFFCPLNQQPVLRNMGLFINEEYPIADFLYNKGFYIPSGMALTENEMIYVVKSLKEVL
jgi:perosamine synthetase